MIASWFPRSLGVTVLAFFVGGAVGSALVTERAVRAAAKAGLDYAAEREAAVSKAYAEANREFTARLKEETAIREAADLVAHQTYQEGIRSASRDLEAAKRAIAAERVARSKEEETNEGLKGVNEMLAAAARDAADCSFSPNVRMRLDDAAGADPGGSPAVTGAGSPAAAGADGAGRSGSRLTCDQLLRGYAALGFDRRVIASRLDELQGWLDRVYPAETP